MRNMRQHHFRERGQATMEIAAAAVAIVILVMGFFTLGGIGITSIKSLLLTRYAAEMDAQGTTTGSGSGKQLAGWTYSVMTQKSANSGEVQVTIPFLAGDEERRTSHGVGAEYLDESADSLSLFPDRAQKPEDAAYCFLRYRQMPETRVPGTIYAGDSVTLSMLNFHAAELPEESRGEQIYLFRTMSDAAAFKARFRASGWFDVSGIDITKWPSSTFAWPAFGSRRGLIDGGSSGGSADISANITNQGFGN